MTDRWFDDAAGPVVRPYAMTRGRTSSGAREVPLDLIALVIADEAESGPGAGSASSAGGATGSTGTADGEPEERISGASGEAGDGATGAADGSGRTEDSGPDGGRAGSGGGGEGGRSGGGGGGKAADAASGSGDHTDLLADTSLAPEHIEIVVRCRRDPQTVAELAADLDLPLGVVRVLIGDLLEAGWVRVSRPVPPAELPDESILREVIDGLRAL